MSPHTKVSLHAQVSLCAKVHLHGKLSQLAVSLRAQVNLRGKLSLSAVSLHDKLSLRAVSLRAGHRACVPSASLSAKLNLRLKGAQLCSCCHTDKV